MGRATRPRTRSRCSTDADAALIARRVSSLLVALVLLSGCGSGPTGTSPTLDGPPTPPAARVEVNALLYSAFPVSPDSVEFSWEVVVSPLAGGRRNITEHPASDTEPTGSLDGSTLAFQTDRDGNLEIYYAENVADIIDFLPPALRRLTDHSAQDIQPALSPDGSKVAFVSDRGGGFDIYVQDLAGAGPPAKITDLRSATNPAWSPDGQRIAFQRGRDIWTMNVDGTELRRLTASSSSSEVPAWSPDGQRIAFQRGRDIWTMNVDGTDQRPFHQQPSALLAHPVWAGDGQSIYFQLDCSSVCGLGCVGVCGVEVPMDGIYFKRLAAGDANVVPGTFFAKQPAWVGSP